MPEHEQRIEDVVPHQSDSKLLPETTNRLKSRSVLYALANIGDKLISFFLLVPLYARYLTPAAYGLIALSDSVGQIVVRVFGLSMDDSLRRLYFQYVDEPAKLKQYVSTVLWSVLATVGLMLAVSFTVLPIAIRRFAPGFDVPFYPYIALSLVAAIGMYVLLYQQVLFQVQSAAEKYLAISAVSFALSVLFAVALVVFLQWGAYGMLLAKMLAGICVAAICIVRMRGWFSGGWKWGYFRETIHLSLPLIPHYLMTSGLDVADRFILARYRPLAEVGLYSLAYTFGKGMYIIGLSLNQAWSPTFFELARRGEQERVRLGVMSSTIGLLMIWIATAGSLGSQIFIIYVLDDRYHPAARVVPWIIGSFLFQGLYALCMLSAMQVKRSILLFYSSAVAFAANLVLNLVLAPRFGMYGAAYANLLSFMVIAVVMYVFAQQRFHIPYQMGRVIPALAVYFGALFITQMRTTYSRGAFNGVAFLAASGLLFSLSGHDLRKVVSILRSRNR